MPAAHGGLSKARGCLWYSLTRELGRQNATSQQKLRAMKQRLKPQLYDLEKTRQPSSRATLGELTFHSVAENVKQLFI